MDAIYGTLLVGQSRGVTVLQRCGQDVQRRNGVAFICRPTDEMRRCVMGFNPVSDIIATIRLQCKPVNMTVLQVYAPTSTAEEEWMEEFYEKV